MKSTVRLFILVCMPPSSGTRLPSSVSSALVLWGISALTLLPACARQGAPGAAPETAAGAHAFTYTPPAGAPEIISVTVPGSFNHWSPSALPMRLGADGVWRASVPLEEGEHEYKFHINGEWPSDMCDDRTWGDPSRGYWIDPGADRCEPDGNQGRNAIVLVEDRAPRAGLGFEHDPLSAAHVSAAGGRVSVRVQVNVGELRDARVIAGRDTFAMHPQLAWRGREMWRASLPAGVRSYTIALGTARGAEVHGPFTAPDSLFTAHAWVGRSIGYQIFPERFSNGDPSNDHLGPAGDAYHVMHPSQRGAPPVLTRDWSGPVAPSHCCHQYFGGDLQGIIDRLHHLESMSVTLLYMTPIFAAGSAHGYDTFDYTTVSPAFGDEATLRALLDAAHAGRMRVMWDFVPNHVGVGHPAFRDAVRNGPASSYWNWFTFRVPHTDIEIGNGAHYEAWSGFGSLPKLDTRRDDVRTHLLDVVRQWTHFGFDGIRVDVPYDIVNRKEFFRAFRQAAREIRPDVYLVGEIWQRSPDWVQGDEFDALMNYAIGIRVIERFANGDIDAPAAAQEMWRLYAEYPEASTAMQFNLISSHDTGRLLTKLGGGGLGDTPTPDALARQRLASAMLYALPGVPVTFQGDECAFLGSGGGREENRYPVQWDRCDQEMLAHYRELGILRLGLPQLASPVIRSHRAEGRVLSFLRGEPGPDELLAVFNASPSAAPFTLPTGRWRDAATHTAHSGRTTLPAYGWLLLARQ